MAYALLQAMARGARVEIIARSQVHALRTCDHIQSGRDIRDSPMSVSTCLQHLAPSWGLARGL